MHSTGGAGEPLSGQDLWNLPFVCVEVVALGGRALGTSPILDRTSLWLEKLSLYSGLVLKKRQALVRVRRWVLGLGWVVTKGFLPGSWAGAQEC